MNKKEIPYDQNLISERTGRMNKEKSVQEIRHELGDEINPIYVTELLRKNTPDLVAWIQHNLHDIQPTLHEIRSYVQQYYVLKNETYKDSLLFGISILEKNCALVMFVLKEIRSRTEAI